MLKAALFALCLLTTADICALTSYSLVETVRVGSKVVRAGDDFAKIRDDYPPDKTIPLINRYGVKRGDELWYDRGNGSYTVIRVDNYNNVISTLDLISR